MNDAMLKTNLENLVVLNPNDKTKIIDTLCGLANGKDYLGYIFGVQVLDSNNEAVLFNTRLASRYGETIMETINELGKMIFPEYLPKMTLEDKDGDAIVFVECLPGENAPYIYPENLDYQNFIEGTKDLEAFKVKEPKEEKIIPPTIQSFTFEMDDEDEEDIEPVTNLEPVIEQPVTKPEPAEPVLPQVEEKPVEKVKEETRSIHFTSKTIKDYIYQKDFIGPLELQLEAFRVHFVNNYIEGRLYPDQQQAQYNYNADLVMTMCKEAYSVANGDLDIVLSKDDLRILFDCDDQLEFNDLDWDVDFDEKAEFILPINTGYIHHSDGTLAANRRSNAEIRSLVLEVLTEPMSTNELAKKMGYKGISKTLSQIVKGLVNEEKIEYMNPDNPRSSNQKLRRKF